MPQSYNHSCKEDIVSRKRFMMMGIWATVAAISLVSASGSSASDANRGDGSERIGHGGSTYQSKSARTGDCQAKVEVIERIGQGGSIYRSQSGQISDCQSASDTAKPVDAVERIGHGGIQYSSSQTMKN